MTTGRRCPLAEPWSGACLFDSNVTVKDKSVWPICGEGALPFQSLLDDYQHERYAKTYTINPSAMVKSEGSNQGFYAGSLVGRYEEGYYYPATASDSAPGWLSTRPGEGIAPRKAAYMWPVAELDGRCVTLNSTPITSTSFPSSTPPGPGRCADGATSTGWRTGCPSRRSRSEAVRVVAVEGQ